MTLDLNGHTVDRGLDGAKKKGCVIEVLGDLTVTDTSAEQTGEITGGYTDGTGGVWVRSDGAFRLAGGAITGNTAKNVGGGVYLSGSGASFTMTGGAITGNAAKNGGGLAMDNAGSAEVSNGAISGNTATNNGGGVWIGKGTSFTLSGGGVAGNTAASQGGGVYINDGSFEYTGGSVAENQQTAGGDIAAKSGSYLPKFPITVTVSVDSNDNEGGTVLLTVGPDTVHDYQLKSLTVTAGDTRIPTTPGADGTYTFTMPAAAVTVDAQFREPHCINTYVFLYNDPYTDHGCTLTADKTLAIEGETVTLTMHLEPGYVFTGCDVNTDASIPVTAVNDTTFTFVMPDYDAEAAVYIEKAEFFVSLGGEADRGVMFLLNGEPKETAPFPVQYGDWITVLFYPEDQMISAMTYTHTENGKTVTNTISFYESGDHLEGRFRMPNGDVTVRVEFSGVYNVTEDWDHVENGLISAEVTKAAAGSYVTVYAVADERYAFDNWRFTPSVTLDSDVTDAEGTRIATFAMPEEDVSFYATFRQTIFDVTAALPDGHGAITGDDWGRAGEECSFTVTPDSGYSIKTVSVLAGGEELDCTNDEGVYTFTMPYANVTLTAEFEPGSAWSDLAGLLREGGAITLTTDYTATGEDDNLYIPESVSATLDLNGHTVDGSALPGSVVDVLIIDGALELGDSAGGGKIIGYGGDDVVYVRSGSFVMTGGTIGTAGSDCGCVYVNEESSFLLTDGTLNADDCYSCVHNNGSFDMQGGVLTGNVWEATAYNINSVMSMSGGSIGGRAGADYCYGYGVYLIRSYLFLSGAAEIDVIENQFEDDPETNVDLHDYDLGVSYGMIYVVGALDPDGPVLGIDSHYYLFAEGDAAEEGGEVYTLTQSDADRFKSADPAYGVRLTDGNTLELALCYSVTVSDDIENGEVLASVSAAPEGAPVTLTVTPAGGYEIDTVTVNGTELEPADGRYGFEMPAEDVTVWAGFALCVTPDQAAANEVIAKIDAIGEVEYTESCKAKIDDASDAYEALTGAQKELVTNAQTLADAIARYNELKAQAEQAATDRAAADEVIGRINAIGEVEYTEACKAKIDDASDAYEALTGAQKALVSNAQTLADAVARYNELKAQAETPTDPTDPTEPTEPTEPDNPSGDNICKWDNTDHGTSFLGRLTEFFHSILYFFAHLFGRR